MIEYVGSQYRKECPFLCHHMFVQLFSEIVELVSDHHRRLVQHIPHRNVLGNVFLDHSLEQALAPLPRPAQQWPEQLSLAEVVLIEIGPHALESFFELDLVHFASTKSLRDRNALGEARANSVVLSDQSFACRRCVHAARRRKSCARPKEPARRAPSRSASSIAQTLLLSKASPQGMRLRSLRRLVSPGTTAAVVRGMAAIFALVLVPALAAILCVLGDGHGHLSLSTIAATLTFFVLIGGLLTGLFRLARQWDAPTH
ncbi:MAG: hypothetical protein ABJE66_06830 [Deltaproteobacteria bacterium]